MKKLLSVLLALCLMVPAFAMASAEDNTVTIYTRYTSYEGWPKLVEAVEKATGVKINSVTASSEYSDYVTKISSAMTIGDSSYDIIDVDELLGVTFIAAGYLEPITQSIQPSISHFLSTWMQNISKGGDDYYMVPSGYSAIYLYANKQLFKAAGLEYPKTYDEFISAAQKLTNADKGVYGLGSAWKQGGYMFNDIQRLIMAFDGDFYDWNNENTRKAIQFMYDQVNTYKYTPTAAISDDYSAACQKFADGQYAMMFMWQNGYDAVKDNWDNYEIIDIPTFNKAATIMNSWGFAINKFSQNKEAAQKVIAAITSYDAQINMLGMEGSQYDEVLASPEAVKVPYVVALAKYGKEGIVYPRVMPVTVNEIQDIMETNVSAYVSGQISLDDCCKNVNAGIQDLS